jgi:hypothetical protein
MGLDTNLLLKRHELILALWLVCIAPVFAGGAEDWSSQYDARLSQALGSEPSEAIAVYEALLAQLPQENPQRGDVLYWLGRARWSAGDLAGAKQSLESARGYRNSRPRARILLGRLSAEEKAVRGVPYREEFRHDAGPWVRGWERGRENDLSVHDGPGGRVARWVTEVQEGEDDFLIFGLNTDGAKIGQFAMRIWSDSLTSHFRILIEDDEGRRWTAPVQVIKAGKWRDVSISLKDFVRADAPAARGKPDSRRLKWFIFRDVTAFHSAARGENTVFIDDLSIR